MNLRPSNWIKAFAFFMGCLPAAALAQEASSPARNLAADLVGITVADRPSEHYRFETHRLDSADGQRHYRIQIAIPRTTVPEGGRNALYMLDGNAAIDTLTEQDLEMLFHRNAPVLIAVGYDVPTRNDVVSRAYDYTPPVFENGQPIARPVVRGRLGGGADIFLAFINERVKPLAQARAQLGDTEYLWGHSYGGLFALHALFTQPDAFSGYIAGDPSAWWHEGALIQEWNAFDPARAAGKRVAILAGTKPRESSRPAPDAAPVLDANGKPLDLRRAVREMAVRLQENGAWASHETFPEHGHGDMIRVSLEHALRIASEP